METNNKTAALSFAQHGLAVFPVHWIRTDGACSCGKSDCHSPGKHPLTKNGCHAAVSDNVQIEKWWTTNPEANIGIATGPRSGLFVIDAEKDGVTPFEKLFESLACPTVITGGGGKHYWFADSGLKNSAKLHGLAVDTRGVGGYVLAPPSNHRSGERYVWEHPVEGPLPKLPDELLEWIQSARPVSKPLTFIGDLDECPGVSEGSRNQTLAEYVGRHLAYGEPTTTIIDKAVDWGLRCNPPMAESEVYQTVRSVEQKHRESQSQDEGDDSSEPKPSSNREKSQAAKLIELCHGIELFHSPDCDAYASYQTDGHRECWSVRSKAFKVWLSRQFWNEYQSVPSSQAREDALNTLEGFAIHEGDEEQVYVRIASVSDGDDNDDINDNEFPHNLLVIDLGTPDWSCIVVNREGWEVRDTSPVRFRRPRGMRPLPIPQRGGQVDTLRGLLNVRTTDWPLLAGWILGALNPLGPFPILALNGEAGSGKSTASRVIRSLIDPNEAPLRRQPKDDQDLVIAANNCWLLCYDNISRIHAGLSDALCRLSTGGGFSTRTLYSNDEETIFNVMRPCIINGIEDLANRGDLMDRLVPITLERIEDADRLPEKEYWNQVRKHSPGIFGALLTALSQALREQLSINLETLPRMADFAVWASAGETALGLHEGEFMSTYHNAQQGANEVVLESSLVAQAIRKLVAQKSYWTGSATELLYEIEQFVSEKDRTAKYWPKDGIRMSGQLRRISPNLRQCGIDVEFLDRQKGQRTIVLQDNSRKSMSSTSSTSPDDIGDVDDNEFSAPSNGFKFVC